MPRAPIQHPRLYLAPAAWVVVLVAVSLLNAGCANQDRKAPTKESPALLDKQEPGRVTQVQQSLMIFVDQFMPALAEGFDYIERNATAPEARAAAKARKINGALAALKNAVNPQPYAGLLDMVVMVTLLSDRASATAAKELYGPYSERLTTGLAAQRAEIWSVAARYITAEQLEELSQSIQEWQNAHPERQYLAFVRIDGFPETRQIQQDRKPARRANSVYGLLFLDPLSNLDPAVREFEMSRQLAERAFFYLQRMPLVIAWQTEQVFSQMVGAPEVQSAISSIGTLPTAPCASRRTRVASPPPSRVSAPISTGFATALLSRSSRRPRDSGMPPSARRPLRSPCSGMRRSNSFLPPSGPNSSSSVKISSRS